MELQTETYTKGIYRRSSFQKNKKVQKQNKKSQQKI